MTKKECAIVMAHTGVCMLQGADIFVFYEYIEEIMERPVYTHELADESTVAKIKEKSKADFIALCRNATDVESEDKE